MIAEATLEERTVEYRKADDRVDSVTGVEFSVKRALSTPKPSTGRVESWYSSAERQLIAISRLRAGWDSQGGDPLDKSTLWSGAALLRVLAEADASIEKPHINPTRSGGVQFHWECGPRYFEIEVLDSETAHYYYVDSSLNFETEDGLRVGDSVNKVLRLLRDVGQR